MKLGSLLLRSGTYHILSKSVYDHSWLMAHIEANFRIAYINYSTEQELLMHCKLNIYFLCIGARIYKFLYDTDGKHRVCVYIYIYIWYVLSVCKELFILSGFESAQ